MAAVRESAIDSPVLAVAENDQCSASGSAIRRTITRSGELAAARFGLAQQFYHHA